MCACLCVSVYVQHVQPDMAKSASRESATPPRVSKDHLFWPSHTRLLSLFSELDIFSAPSYHQTVTPCRIQYVCYVTLTSLLQFISLLKFLSLIYSLWYRLSFAHLCRHCSQRLCHLSCIKFITHIHTHLIFPSICHFHFTSFFLVWSLFVSSGGSFFIGAIRTVA